MSKRKVLLKSLFTVMLLIGLTTNHVIPILFGVLGLGWADEIDQLMGP